MHVNVPGHVRVHDRDERVDARVRGDVRADGNADVRADGDAVQVHRERFLGVRQIGRDGLAAPVLRGDAGAGRAPNGRRARRIERPAARRERGRARGGRAESP